MNIVIKFKLKIWIKEIIQKSRLKLFKDMKLKKRSDLNN